MSAPPRPPPPARAPAPPASALKKQTGLGSGDGIFKTTRRVNKFAAGGAGRNSGTVTAAASPGNTAGGGMVVDGANGSQGSSTGQAGATPAAPSTTMTNPKPTNLTNPRSITPLPSRLTSGPGSRPGTPSRSRPSGSNSTSTPPTRNYDEFPIKLLPRLSSLNPATTTDPVLRALPFPTSLNILHIRHPPSSTVPVPDLLASHHPTPIHLNRKDPAAPPPPDPAIVAARNAERDLIAQIKTPVRQDDGTWKVRLWDWNNKCEKRDPETGEVVWKEAKDPALFAPDLGDSNATASNAKKWKFKSKFGNKRGGGKFGGGGGGRGGAVKQGEVRTNVKMREQGLLFRSAGQGGVTRIDLPDETESEDERVPLTTAGESATIVDEAQEEPANKKSGKGKGKKSAAMVDDLDMVDPIDTSVDINSTSTPALGGKLNKKSKTYRRAAVLANIRNREKLPLVLEGEFGHPLREPRPVYSTPIGGGGGGRRPGPGAVPGTAPGSAAGVVTAPNGQVKDEPLAEVTPEPPAKNRYVSHSISSTNDHYLALIFNGHDIGLRWVGREYEFGLRVDDMAKERERAALESMGRRGRGRWGGRGGASRFGQGRAAGVPGAPVAGEGEQEGEVVEGDVDMELYRPGSASNGADVKPSIDTGDNPDAFPRMLSGSGSTDVKPRIKSDPDERGGRGRGRDTKPLMSLQDKLKVFEQAEYGYAPSGSGRAIDEDALERRGRGRGRAGRIKFEDDDDELGGRRRAVGRSDVERGADEHWDVEDVGEQDDEEEVHVNADDEREARERGAILSGEYHMANANVGLLQRDDVEDSDSDDLSPDRAEARKREKKRERRLKRKLAGAKESDTESETEEEESESSSEESEVEEEEDVKPDISALNAATNTAPTASPTKDKSSRRSASPASRAARSPAPPVKREASPAGSFGRATSVDRGAGHVLAARRAISPAGQRGSVEPGAAARNSKKRKAPPMQSTAPPESGGSRQTTPVTKKARANTEGPSPTNSGPGTPAAVDYAMQELDAPVVSGSGGPATAEMGHTPIAAKKHKARGKKSRNPGEAGGDSPATHRSGSSTSDRFGSPGPSSSRQGSPAPSASRRPMSKGPKKESTPPQDIEAEKAKLRTQTFPGALTAKHVHDLLSGGAQFSASQLFSHLKPTLVNPNISPEQQQENQKRLRNICNWFCNKIKLEDGTNTYAWGSSERYE